jgi:hypothetical protein
MDHGNMSCGCSCCPKVLLFDDSLIFKSDDAIRSYPNDIVGRQENRQPFMKRYSQGNLHNEPISVWWSRARRSPGQPRPSLQSVLRIWD